ncbi:MAG: hypothetical protein AB1696_17340 [Planctomycetota bacterium]
MSEEKKQPWPASWPPFWRLVLHIAIATAVGNVALAGGFAFLVPPSHASTAWILTALSGETSMILIILVSAGLMRAEWRTASRLLLAFFLGTLVMVLPLLYVFPHGIGFTSLLEGLCSKLETAVGLRLAIVLTNQLCVTPPIAFLGFGVVVMVARYALPQIRRRRLFVVWILGSALLWWGTLWALVFREWGDVILSRFWPWFSTAWGDFFGPISFFVWYPFTYAVTVRMLIGAVKEAKAPSE